VIRLGEPQAGDAEAVEDLAQRVVAEGVRVPLRHDDHGLSGFALPSSLFPLPLHFIPAGVDLVILRVGCADGGGEAQEGLAAEFADCGAALPFACLLQDLQPEVRGCGVVHEPVRCGPVVGRDDALVERDHGVERGELAAGDLRGGLVAAEVGEVLEPPLQGALHAVRVPGGESVLPRIHPLAVKLRQHALSLPRGCEESVE
jgi:hypothetical protein